jgi:GT2 family glycosyltransferase
MLHHLYPLHVVLLNWNLPDDTIQCVDSIRVNLPPDVEIIIVDNGSTDDSATLLGERFGSQVKLIENLQNLGFAGGVNVGIRYALEKGAQSVLLLNNDTTVHPDMISHLVSAAAEHPRAGVVGPVIYYYNRPQRIWRFGDREYRWLPVPVQLPNHLVSKAKPAAFQVDYVTACAMLIRREVLERVGLFDTRYFMYFEDADFCRRVRQAGYEIWCIPEARMWHKVSLSARKQKPATRYAQAWGRAQFYQQHPHGFSRRLTFVYLLVKSVLTTMRDALSQDWELVKAQWMGTIDGHYNRPSRLSNFLK